MTSSPPVIKGWCPGALRPMMSGDGLVVRIRPPAGRLTQQQAAGIATLATRCGNGIVDLSNRANVQLRGVAEHHYDTLIDGLRALNLIDPDATVESRRNIMCTPFCTAGDVSAALVAELTIALASPDAPNVSAKFGYAIDLDQTPVLQGAPADIRLEHGADGQVLLCSADHSYGKPVACGNAVAEMLDLARWSLGHGTRMARILSAGTPLPDGFDTPRQQTGFAPKPGLYRAGALVAAAFGQFDAETLAALAAHGPLRVTPWRMVLIEGAKALPMLPGLICDPDDPMLRVSACVGAPACEQGHSATRPMARTLARQIAVGQTLHVAGCTKGCALPRAATVTLTATPAGFNLIQNGTADAVPSHIGLTSGEVPDYLQKALL